MNNDYVNSKEYQKAIEIAGKLGKISKGVSLSIMTPELPSALREASYALKTL